MRDVMSNVRCCRENAWKTGGWRTQPDRGMPCFWTLRENTEKGAGTERRNQIMYFLRAETKVLS